MFQAGQEHLLAGLEVYFRISPSYNGNETEKISESEFEGLIHDDKTDYKLINEDIYSIDAHSDSSDPSEWEFEEYKDYFDDIDTLEIDTLKEYLKEMGASFTSPPGFGQYHHTTCLSFRKSDEIEPKSLSASSVIMFQKNINKERAL